MNERLGRRLGTGILLLVALVLAFSSAKAAAAADDKTGESFKELGKEMKEFGKKVGKAGKEAGLQIADAAKKVWYKSWQVAEPKLEQVGNATRDYWGQVLKGKDIVLEELRRENAELKKRLAEKNDGG